VITKPENLLKNEGSMASPNSENPSFNDLNDTRGEKFDYLRITDTTPTLPLVPVISLCGQTISTAGNITTISGEAKIGKSGFVGILISAALSQNGIVDGLDELYVQPNTFGKGLLYFDTEHSQPTHWKNLMSILKRCELLGCPDFLGFYNLKSLDPEEYSKVTSEICEYTFNKFGGIHMIIIDNGADYLTDFNDPVESSFVVNYFEKLAEKYSATVIITIHTTGKREKEIGHLGSCFQRRSESVLSIIAEGEISFVIPKFLRMADKKDIIPIAFRFDKELGYNTGCKIENQILLADDTDRGFLISKICVDIFKEGTNLLSDEIVDAIIKKTHKATGTAKNIFKEMVAHNMIIQGGDKKWIINPKYNYNKIGEN